MTELEDDEDWARRGDEQNSKNTLETSGEDVKLHSKRVWKQGDEDPSNYEIGEEYIDRFARCLSAERSLPVVFQKVGEYVAGNDWKKKVYMFNTTESSHSYAVVQYDWKFP